jgi:putative ATPase
MSNYQPLAARMRPQTIDQFFGQLHLLGHGKPLRRVFEEGLLHSMILWGPPGTGKTTLAKLLATRTNAHLESISAVLAGVKEIRAAITRAQEMRASEGKPTILFVDEVHRFNKAQQDAFLPYVEEGILTLIGATTENPSFELNNALLSRTRVYVLKGLNTDDMLKIIDRALHEMGDVIMDSTLRPQLVQTADGDARRVLNLLEIASDLAIDQQEHRVITEAVLREVLAGGSLRRFDKSGDLFYEQISALHKAVRGSSPDAALYWLVRMLDGGCDPLYIARRMVRMASEDIGNADPRALEITLNAWDAYDRLGSPEGELMLAQSVTYLACAPKSNAVYMAYKAAQVDVATQGSLDVPMHLRNAPTGLMRNMDYGKQYRYAHDEPDAYAPGETYFPTEMGERQYYYPVPRGLEIKIGEKLARLRELDKGN